MSDLRFLFAVHNHQPVGNFADVFERAFRDCYRPFLETVAKHPGFRFTAHFSGPLWEHMREREKASFKLVEVLVGRGQVELLSGGFYEPILAVIPEEDRVGQIRMMNDFLSANFGRTPRGLWLTERVWEPHLPKSLAQAGISYTLLDEEHFHYAGVGDLHTTYVTEEEGAALRVFPIDKKLRYLIPFRSLPEVGAYFEEIRAAGGTAILGDDGEKFGLWPGTRSWVYEQGWLESFLRWLDESGVRTMTCGEFFDETPPAGQVYLPPASYEEMMEWVLEPADQARLHQLKEKTPPEDRRFLRGGFFRDFFRKYPEANHLHKRMVFVSREVARHAPGDQAARRSLYRAQGNDPYWHGVFGGLYLPHLREAAYTNLLEAEKRTPASGSWREVDYDADGRVEYVRRDSKFGLWVKPAAGGALVEVDHLPSSRNLTDVLSRRPEAYHQERSETGGAEGKSIHELGKKLPPEARDLMRYDWHPRYSALDHFFNPETRAEDVARLEYGEQGDFIDQPYRAEVNGDILLLMRTGGVWVDGERRPVTIRKTIQPAGPCLHVRVEIRNEHPEPFEIAFGAEWNLLAFPHETDIRPKEAVLLDGRLVFRAAGATLWHFPLRTLSQSEEGFDIIEQGVCLIPVWTKRISGGQTIGFDVELKDQDGS
ncbi:MAG: DUF1926 domain-containing protein [Candidatus Aminicenantes bacterium]|nr:DUF1926 domain-containing protein [Candidatus Aminicenantes bacterium]